MDERLRGLMGLCVRAGQAVFGEDSCLKAIRSGQIGLVLLDGEISEGSEEKYLRACEGMKVPVRKLPGGTLAETTGKSGMAMAVRVGGFADQLRSRLAPEGAKE